MKLVTGQVIAGRIDVPPEIIDGTRVAILAPENDKPIALSLADERELSDSLAEIRDGRCVDGWDLLEKIKATSQA